MLCPISFSPLSLESAGERRAYFCHSLWTHTQEQFGIFAWNLNHADKTSLETFYYTQVSNLKYLFLIIVLVIFNFLLLFFAIFCILLIE